MSYCLTIIMATPQRKSKQICFSSCESNFIKLLFLVFFKILALPRRYCSELLRVIYSCVLTFSSDEQ